MPSSRATSSRRPGAATAFDAWGQPAHMYEGEALHVLRVDT